MIAAEADLVEVIAQRTAELVLEALRRTPAASAALVDASELARILGCSRDVVYRYRVLLGGEPLGDGPRPRLRFDVERALEAWSARLPSERPPKRDSPAGPALGGVRRRRRIGTGSDLLPVRGPVVPEHPAAGRVAGRDTEGDR